MAFLTSTNILTTYVFVKAWLSPELKFSSSDSQFPSHNPDNIPIYVAGDVGEDADPPLGEGLNMFSFHLSD